MKNNCKAYCATAQRLNKKAQQINQMGHKILGE